VSRLVRDGDRVVSVVCGDTEYPADQVISSMALPHLVLAMDPPPPDHVRAAADALRHRDFVTVALVVPAARAFPDNWIYVHAPEVRVGRIQNYGAWSPDLVQGDRTCLGLEYFSNEGDDLWTRSDDDLVELATHELAALGLAAADDVDTGYVVRVRDAYPVYDADYERNVGLLRSWLDSHAANVHPVGRNGMHRYNNQDHSMYTAMVAVEHLLGRGSREDTWQVNVEREHHEQAAAVSFEGAGRGAPVFAVRDT
jgi:UDP-galactopyranose mutase